MYFGPKTIYKNNTQLIAYAILYLTMLRFREVLFKRIVYNSNV